MKLLAKAIADWLFGGRPKYQNIPYNTRTGMVVPRGFREDKENEEDGDQGTDL